MVCLLANIITLLGRHPMVFLCIIVKLTTRSTVNNAFKLPFSPPKLYNQNNINLWKLDSRRSFVEKSMCFS